MPAATSPGRRSPPAPSLRFWKRAGFWIAIGAVIGVTLWLGLWPWSTYTGCGSSRPDALPATVRVGLYEEFPVSGRLDKLHQLDFPVRLAVAAGSREEFLQLRDAIEQEYPQVEEVFFWPLLSIDEGYYPGTWSKAQGIERLAREADGLPTLWDMEWPRQGHWYPGDWPANRAFLHRWLQERAAPTHIWRGHAYLGLEPRALTLAGMHFSPDDYPNAVLHLELYTTGEGLPDELIARLMRCGVERYGERFVPALGVLDDQEGPESLFIPAPTLARYLEAARQAGVSEVWLFGANGLNADYLAAIRAALPLAPLEEGDGH